MEKLEKLIAKAMTEDVNSLAYKQLFSQIMNIMQNSGKIWENYTILDSDSCEDSYHNALLKTWEWLRSNLPQYDPERGNIYTWFNNKLNYKIRDENNRRRMRENSIANPYFNRETGEFLNPIDLLPDPNSSSNLLEVINKLLAEHEPYLIRIYPRGCSEGNCDYLLKHRLPLGDIKPWKVLAKELNSNAKTLNTLYRKKCLPYLKRLLENEGYEI